MNQIDGIDQIDRIAQRKGFTLFELMFVLLLLGFMLLLTFPNFRQFFGPRDLKRAVLGFFGTLRYAQSQAATTKIHYRLNVDVKENVFWISREGEKGKFDRDPSSYGRITSLPPGVIFLDVYHPERGKVRDGAAFVEFSPTGWAEECTIHIRKSEQEVYTLFIHPLGGKVEVVEGYAERVKE
jgi:prepilin-type N-terminal cleavage/methylation domain-containing protein